MMHRPTIIVVALALGLAGCARAAPPSAAVPAATPSEQALLSSPSTPNQSGLASTPAASAAPSLRPLPAELPGNGVIVYSDPAGDIHSLDPETGKATLIIGGPTNDFGPGFLPGQTRFQFIRLEGGEDVFYSANADGSDVQRVRAAKEMANFEYSPTDDRIASVREGGSDPTITDVASGSSRVIPLTKPVNIVSWLTDDLLFVADLDEEGSAVEMWTVKADGTGQVTIPAPDMCCGVSTLRGRGLIAWNSWTSGAEGRVHILDTATGKDTLLASTDVPGETFLGPIWSPDGKWLTAKHAIGGEEGVDLVLLPSDGSGPAISLGPRILINEGEIRSTFSPDGTKILLTYESGSAWLYRLPAGSGGKVNWPGLVAPTWQALPPASP